MPALVARLGALLPRGELLEPGTWRLRHVVVMGLLAAHLPLLAAVGVAGGHGFWAVLVGLAPIPAGLALGCVVRGRSGASLGTTAGLMLSSAVLVYFARGAPEAHLASLVLLVFVALYQDWRPYLLALGLITAHRLFGVFVPTAVYGQPAAIVHPLRSGLIHSALVLVVSTATLTLWKLNENERRSYRRYCRRLYESQRAASKQLREAEELKAQLIAIVSHEFRTPLTSILGYAQTLSARINAIDEAGAVLFAARIEREAKRLSRLVHNLLAASGDVQVEPGLSADLREVADEVADELQEAYSASGDRIDVGVPRNLRAAIGTEPMHRIVTNLVDNALKFAEDGTAVKLRGRRESDRVVLEVANVGPPIPINARERIFQPFVQLDSSDTRSFDGMGMGLPIARKLVSTHQGAIQIRCDGRLVVFRVSLPSAVACYGHGAVARGGVRVIGAEGEALDPAVVRAAAG